eukprot:2356648-Pleurochrysis_carterae.AAC.1
MSAWVQMLRAPDALKIGPPGPFWQLAAPKRAAPQGSSGGRHTTRPLFGPKFCAKLLIHRRLATCSHHLSLLSKHRHLQQRAKQNVVI